MSEALALQGGIYPPIPTFFHDDETLDIATLRRHVLALSATPIAGYVVMGTNGEAVHLDEAERARVVETVRTVAGAQTLVLAGCGAQSTRATLAYCQIAASAGADAALVLPPFYYKDRMHSAALLHHYRAVADASPLPVVIYNMPASAAGLNLDADMIITLAEHPRIIGVKDSAGDMAKLAQIVERTTSDFGVFAGSAGYLLPALAVGAIGAVAALANVFPNEVCRLQELFYAGQWEEARVLQARLAPANSAVTSIYTVPGLKAALELTVGYGGPPRSPLLPLSREERLKLTEILTLVQVG